MGFKCINQTELKIKSGPNFIGVPLRFMQEITQDEEYRSAGVQISKTTTNISEITIINDESLDFHYNHNMVIKSAEGYGNISIINNSYKDRIWDTRIELKGTDIDHETNLGIFEPRTNKNIRYSIESLEDISKYLLINESIEILNEEIRPFKNLDDVSGNYHYNSLLENGEKRYLLLYGKENLVKFTIILENNSSLIIKNINVKKELSKQFYDIECIGDSQLDVNIRKNILKLDILHLNPGEKKHIIISTKILPEKKQRIKTGGYDISYKLENIVLSGTEIKDFSAYSHAKHLINLEEKETKPNYWECYFLFANHSDFNLFLDSILITDKSKVNKFVELDFISQNNRVKLSPGESYTTQKWELFDENEPKFSRKVVYSLDYNIEKRTSVNIKVDDEIFEIMGFHFEKDISHKELNSFEEKDLYNNITIHNTGDVAIKGIIINEIIPEDFKPPLRIDDFKLKNSSGELKLDNLDLKIMPPNEDPSSKHTLELIINLTENQIDQLLAVNEYLEICYPIKAISPDYNKSYDFPLEISCFYLKYNHQEQEKEKEYYVVKYLLSEMQKPTIKVSHKRRNLAIAKEIFPGRENDEFAVCVNIRNKSNIELKNVSITDTIPNTFEIISSNIINKVSKSKNNDNYTISFSIESVQPFQEKEIMYYLKNKTGNEVKFSELESYFIG